MPEASAAKGATDKDLEKVASERAVAKAKAKAAQECRNFLTDEGCPYGRKCQLMHPKLTPADGSGCKGE